MTEHLGFSLSCGVGLANGELNESVATVTGFGVGCLLGLAVLGLGVGCLLGLGVENFVGLGHTTKTIQV